MRSFSLVLLRRLLFRPHAQYLNPHAHIQHLSTASNSSHNLTLSHSSSTNPIPTTEGTHSLTSGAGPTTTTTTTTTATTTTTPRLALYDHLSAGTLAKLEGILLHSLLHEPAVMVRHKSVDTVCDVANQAMARGRPWHALQAQAFSMAVVRDGGGPPLTGGTTTTLAWCLRESAYKVFAGCPNLVMDLQTEAVVGLLAEGLRDGYSIEVRHAALLASVAYLSAADIRQLRESSNLLTPMLETLPPLAQNLNQPPALHVSVPSPSPSHILTTSPPSLTQSSTTTPLLTTTTTTGTPSSSSSSSALHSSISTSRAGPSNYAHLANFLTTLTPLCSSHPLLFQTHLPALLSFLPALILPAMDSGPTPTVGRPFPSSSASSSAASSAAQENGGGGGQRQSAFMFPPPLPPSSSHIHSGSGSNAAGNNGLGREMKSGGGGGGAVHDEVARDGSENNNNYNTADNDEDERSTLRLSALEFMISLSEARPGMVKKVPGWAEVVVRACLEGMGELSSDEDDLEGWLGDDPSSNSSSTETDSPPALYEQALDRLACALGGRAVLPPAFQYIPSMLASFDWRARHAGLMAIAAIAEGTGRVMKNELGKIVEMVVPMFRDTHPRVRYAACQCIGQLCTDLEDIIQARYHQQLFSALIPALEDHEPRVHSHAAAALINFCEGVERDTLLPYLDPIVERLLKLLNPGGGHGQAASAACRYVQEQVITTLAMVADASEVTFGKHYAMIMPLLLNILKNADGPDYRKLRVKAMECAGLIAIAVGREVFRPESTVLIELLLRIQKSPIDPGDTQLSHYLIATWAKVCQAMGPEFEPYLPIVMPTLLTTAGAKADISIFENEDEERDGWETINVDGQSLGIRTSVIEEKCQAFETLVIYCSTLGARFAPYLAQTLEVALPSLKFLFHEGVREAGALLIPLLLVAGKSSGTLTPQMVSATLNQLVNCISTEHDASFLASLYKAFADCVRVVGGVGALSQDYHKGIIEATQRQLQALAERRKARAGQFASDPEADREDVALVEEFEEFALEDMAKVLMMFDPGHPLLVAVSSVRELGVSGWNSEDERDEDV
ncbi:hypothetical protein AMATHDRAFT_70474, partial [Amanita thiersii Skay4041]